jgi:hypothetical protein
LAVAAGRVSPQVSAEERAAARAARMRRMEELAAAARAEEAARRAQEEAAATRLAREQSTFRARPVDPRVLTAAAPPAVHHKPPTVARSPSLATKARSRRASSVSAVAAGLVTSTPEPTAVVQKVAASPPAHPTVPTTVTAVAPAAALVAPAALVTTAPPEVLAQHHTAEPPIHVQMGSGAGAIQSVASGAAAAAARGRAAATTAFGLRIAGALRKPNVPTGSRAVVPVKPNSAPIMATPTPSAVSGAQVGI